MVNFKRFISLLVITITSTNLFAQSKQTREEYIDKYKDIAIAHMEQYGIPASITMAQGILESNNGNSELSKKSNNHFGIKCKSYWKGAKVYFDDDEKGECFRAYKSVEKSYKDHAEFLSDSPRYESLFSYKEDDYKSWAHGLKSAGYATAPHYATSLIKIIEDNQLYLLDRKDGSRLYAINRESHNLDKDIMMSTSTSQVDPNDFRVTISTNNGYSVYRTNERFFTVVKSDEDTLESISEAFKISKRNLARFNDMDKDDTLKVGDIVYIEKKDREWNGVESTHTIAKGETLRLISQMYGIQLRSLRKLNGLKNSDLIYAGKELKIK